MILVRLMGGLGNQMFQYAFGKMLAVKNNTVLKLDTTLLEDKTITEKAILRDFYLDIFDIPFQFATPQEIIYFNGYPKGSLIQKVGYKITRLLSSRNLVVQNNQHFVKQYLSLPDNTCLVGRWQSEHYFENSKEIIQSDFVVKDINIRKSYTAETISKAVTPISIHVRRGDYVTNEFYNKNIGALEIEYYKKAVSYMTENLSRPTFFIFSEDLEWCKQNFGFINNLVYVTSESSKQGTAQDLHLISLCKHHIISNSTFSWWGAYLCKHPNKIIVAPKKWANSPAQVPEFILPDNWIKF